MAKVKLQYAGNKAHEISFPGAPKTVKTGKGVKNYTEPGTGQGTVRIVFDDEGKAECTADEWRAIEPNASQAGIVKL